MRGERNESGSHPKDTEVFLVNLSETDHAASRTVNDLDNPSVGDENVNIKEDATTIHVEVIRSPINVEDDHAKHQTKDDHYSEAHSFRSALDHDTNDADLDRFVPR
nr:hypothetical protein [Tanacetum cinerariifolium]